ncbi:MAG: hypothetical protein AB9922_03270 [Bacteroidales bacterium]
MESTIISILIAVAIVIFQGYSDKKKKERKRAETAGENYPEEEKLSLTSLFKEIMKDEIPSFKKAEYQDPYESIMEESVEYPVANEAVAEVVIPHAPPVYISEEIKEYKYSESAIEDEGSYSLYESVVPEDIYDSKEISEHSYNEESARKSNLFENGFDPRLFIIYSELAAPKYRD